MLERNTSPPAGSMEYGERFNGRSIISSVRKLLADETLSHLKSVLLTSWCEALLDVRKSAIQLRQMKQLVVSPHPRQQFCCSLNGVRVTQGHCCGRPAGHLLTQNSNYDFGKALA